MNPLKSRCGVVSVGVVLLAMQSTAQKYLQPLTYWDVDPREFYIRIDVDGLAGPTDPVHIILGPSLDTFVSPLRLPYKFESSLQASHSSVC